MRFVTSMLAAGAAVVSAPADAATLVTSADSRGLLRLFDPSLGTLTSVRVQQSFSGWLPFGLYSFEAINPPYDVRIRADQTVTTMDYGVSVRLLIDRVITVNGWFTVDYSTSGERTFTSDLGRFIGTGNAPNIGAIFALPTATVMSTDNVAALYRQQDCPRGCESRNTTITYTYEAGVFPAAVPEPASWATMIAGFGLVGAGMRRRRHAAKASTFSM